MSRLIDALQLRRFLPYRMASQLMFLVGVSVALSSLIAGGVFTYASIKGSREVAAEQILYLGKSISTISSGLLISRDVAGLEDLLRINARLPYIESILIADETNRPVTSVIKRDGKLLASYDITPVLPTHLMQVQSLPRNLGGVRRVFFGLIELQEDYEIWLPVEAGTQIGALRLRYSI